MKRIFFVFTVLAAIISILNFFSCAKTEDLISPYHYSIIPKVTDLKLDSVYITPTNKQAVKISWSIPDTTNLRFFEIYRSQKNPDNYRIIVSNLKAFTHTDSSLPSYNDSLQLFYLVYPIGTKRDIRTGVQTSYIGPPSDTLILYIKKN